MTEFELQLAEALEKINIHPTQDAIHQLALFYEMIIEKNKVMNLTAITEPQEFIHKHFLDSLSLINETRIGQQIKAGKAIKVIDVGTGAGLPGLALKIVYPQLEMVLFDSLKKRLNFLDEVIDKLELKNVRTLHGRAEDLGHSVKDREAYDLALARAVANLSTLSEYCLPLVKKGGQFAAYKSVELPEELKAAEKAITLLGGKVKEIAEFSIPDTDLKRVIAVIEKIKPTPDKYPRKAGMPSKEPL